MTVFPNDGWEAGNGASSRNCGGGRDVPVGQAAHEGGSQHSHSSGERVECEERDRGDGERSEPQRIRWCLAPFHDLTLNELYEVLALRQEVFTVEQTCPYQDCDGRDRKALHLRGMAEGDRLIAYARLFAPGTYVHEDGHGVSEAVIGRVVVRRTHRRFGLGKTLMTQAIAGVAQAFGSGPIRISAQKYLERFYTELGFRSEGQPYLEDDIWHIAMVRPPS